MRRRYARPNVSARVRILAVASAAAASAAAVVIGATLLQSDDGPSKAQAAGPLKGNPPLVLDYGFRTDRETRELSRAEQLYEQGRKRAAHEVFARHASLNARIGEALAEWPNGTIGQLQRLAAANPGSGIVRLNLGLALFWGGRRKEAVAQWQDARRIDPDSLAAVRAGDLLFPNFARGLPVFIPSFDPGKAARLSVPELEARAARGGVRAKLLYGIVLQRGSRPLSARRVYDEAVAQAPNDPEALVAAAVARFEKPDPSPAFARLGPLARRFPDEPTVRFHLGLLLLWMGRLDEAKEQLTKAGAIDPRDPLAREAKRFLRRLESMNTGPES